jgi:7-cyano-7-deazaguanine synthase
MSQPKAVILLSGGLDSATVLALAKAEGYACYALSFAYGQRHHIELDSARKVAQAIGLEQHKIAHIDLRLFGGSALTDELDVPKALSAQDIDSSIPITYVPARNTIFLSFALAWAEVLGAYDIFIGVNAVDYSGYPDCRPDFIAAYEAMANLATAYGVEAKQHIAVRTPLIHMSKAEIIRIGRKLGVDYTMTISCYDPLPDGTPCGSCHSCLLRAKGFAEA